MYNIYGLLINF